MNYICSEGEEKKSFHFLGCATESLTYMPTGPCAPSDPAFPVKPCREEKPQHEGSSSARGNRCNTVTSVHSLSLLELRGVLEVPVSLRDPVRLKTHKQTADIRAIGSPVELNFGTTTKLLES